MAVLLPLSHDCHELLDSIFDGADGVEDGEASLLTNAYDACLAIPIADQVDMLKTLQDGGHCDAAALDGVAETEVPAAGCADMMDQCTLMVSAGLMSCEHDFCDTVPTATLPCLMAGQCDRTCDICGGAGGHRHSLLQRLHELRRHLQMSHIQCDPATFAASATAADDACCDGGSCHDGVPTVCDAKCAVVFNTFYGRCQRFLAAQFDPAEAGNYERLYATCMVELPAEPLLQAIAACGAPPEPEPEPEPEPGACANSNGIVGYRFEGNGRWTGYTDMGVVPTPIDHVGNQACAELCTADPACNAFQTRTDNRKCFTYSPLTVPLAFSASRVSRAFTRCD